MRAYIQFIVRFRYLVIGFLLLVTAASLALFLQAELTTKVHELFFKGDEKFSRYVERIKEYGSDQVIFVAYESADPLSKSNLDRLKFLRDELKKLYFIRNVGSILDVPEIVVADGTISFDTYADKALEAPELAPRILDRLRNDPLVSGLLISPDGKHLLIAIEGNPDPDPDTHEGSLEEGVGMYWLIMEVFDRAGFDQAELHQAGMVPIGVEAFRQIEFNLKTLFPMVCVVLLSIIFIIFRRLWPVVITGLVTIMAVIWTMGFAVLVFGEINMYIALAPGIIMIIAFSDVIHLCSSYLLELSHGEPKELAIEKACSEVGAACFYTSLTTFAGFMSMALVPMLGFRQMGLVFGFGVAVALMLAIVLTPILFSIMKEPKPWRMDDSSRVHGLLDGFIEWIQSLSTRFPWQVVIAFVVLVGISSYGISRIKVEKNLVESFTKDNQLRIDERYFTEHFSGTNNLDVFIETPRAGELLAPGLFAKIAAYEDALENMPEVDKVISLVGLIKTFHSRFRPEEAAQDPLPRTRKELAQYLFLLEDGADLEQLIDFDRQMMRLSMRLDYDGYSASRATGDKAVALAQDLLGDQVEVEVLGLSYIIGSYMDNIIAGQKRSLIYALLVITVMMIIALRSVTVGVWSMIPNVVPIIALGGFVGLVWHPVDADTLLVAIVAISIGVDDTIHFLVRYRIEVGKADGTDNALGRTFHYSGRAIVITSLILATGFAPFALSDYYLTFILGTLLPGCFFVALAADLLLVPALVKLGVIDFHRSGSGEVSKGRA